MRAKILHRIVGSLIVASLAGSQAFAVTIGLDFTSGSGQVMGANEKAGVVSQSHWNSVAMDGYDSSWLDAYDSLGNLSVARGDYNNQHNGWMWHKEGDVTDSGSDDAKMMSGGMKTGGDRGQHSIGFNGLPAKYTDSGYDLYIYFGDGTQPGTMKIYNNAEQGELLQTIDLQSLYFTSYTDAGGYVEATNDAFGLMTGNYIVVKGLTGPNFGIDADKNTLVIAGVQIVPPQEVVPVEITTQPQAASTVENQPFTLKVTATGDPLNYQWRKDGADIQDAISDTYSVALAQLSDSGTYSVRVYNSANSIISSNAVVTVNRDTVKPVLVAAKGSRSFDQVTLSFTKTLDETVAQDVSHYTLSSGVSVSTATVVDKTNIVLTTSPQEHFTPYTVTVNGVKDISGNAVVENSTADFWSFTLGTGVAFLDYYDTGNPGISGLPEVVLNQRPTRSVMLLEAQTATWENGANYGAAMNGFIEAPETGNYVLHISSDDQSALFLSTDENPANLALEPLVSVTGWTSQRQWDKEGNQAAVATLEQGKRYYFQAYQVEGGGGDGLAIGWELPSKPGNIEVIPGRRLGTYLDPTGSSVKITEQPKSLTVVPNDRVTFSVQADTASQYLAQPLYQWYRNGQAIAGANAASYSFTASVADNDAKFKVLVNAPPATEMSAEAALTVLSDTVPPRIVAVTSSATLDNLTVRFSEPVNDITAQNPANYTLSGGVSISGVTVVSPTVVVLATDAQTPDTHYTLTVTGVSDLAGNVMTTGGNSRDFFSADPATVIGIDLTGANLMDSSEAAGVVKQNHWTSILINGMDCHPGVLDVYNSLGDLIMPANSYHDGRPVITGMAWHGNGGFADWGWDDAKMMTGGMYLSLRPTAGDAHSLGVGLPVGYADAGYDLYIYLAGSGNILLYDLANQGNVISNITVAAGLFKSYEQAGNYAEIDTVSGVSGNYLIFRNMTLREFGIDGSNTRVAGIQIVRNHVTTAPAALQIKRETDGKVSVTFDGKLQSTDSVTGAWTNIDATSPYTVAPEGAAKFYRSTK